MKSRVAQYINEIVSITIMLLMAVALIAGQSSAADAARAQVENIDLNIVLTVTEDRKP